MNSLGKSQWQVTQKVCRSHQVPRLREEFLNETLFTSLTQARAALEEWRRDYNTVRPHSRIGWLTPAVYAATFLPQRGQGSALIDGSAPWPVAPTVHNDNRQALVVTG